MARIVKHLLQLLAAATLALVAICDAAAQERNSAPITILVGFPPGDATDFTARLISEPLPLMQAMRA
jgi:tripartite-type tricarboxylate transporter receptor subunit TctC